MRDNPEVTALVTRARNGDPQAWHALVERYAPLIWSICRRYRLAEADAEDVSQNIWLHLVRHLDTLRDPAALPGWLATTTRRECDRKARAAAGQHAAGYLLDTELLPDERAATADQELLEAERHAALREAFAVLPPSARQLLAMLTADQPVPYTEISAQLGIPVGSIGPTRRRCLDKMRRHPAIAALINAETPITRCEMPGQPLSDLSEIGSDSRALSRTDWTSGQIRLSGSVRLDARTYRAARKWGWSPSGRGLTTRSPSTEGST